MSQESSIRFDANGIPLVLEGTTYQYNPVTIEQYGLQQWSYYKLKGTQANLTTAVKMADWLVANQEATTGEWLFTFPDNLGIAWTIPPYGSALAQGQAISLLVRAYLATGNSKYLTTAETALTSLTKPVSVGVAGLTDYFQGHPIYEESPTTPPTHILNGFMFTLFGLYDLSPYSSLSEQLYTQGLQSLDFILPYYDMGDISTYDLQHLTAPPTAPDIDQEYHRFHTTLLRGLETLSPNDMIINHYATAWCNDVRNGLPFD